MDSNDAQDLSGALQWIASYPKSGNTWVRIFIAAYINGGPVNFNCLPWQVCFSDLKTADYQSLSAAPVKDLTQLGVLAYRSAVLTNILIRGGANKNVLVKTHHGLWKVEGYPLFPRHLCKKGVYLIRDPRDVAVSYANHLGMTVDETIDLMANTNAAAIKDPEVTGQGMVHFLGTWSEHVNSWCSAKFPVFGIKYEELCADPESIFRQMIEWLDWKLNEDCLKVAVEATRFNRLKRMEGAMGFLEKSKKSKGFFGNGKPEHWKDVLTKAQTKKIEEAHGETMAKLGYL